MARGWGDRDSRSMMLLEQERANIKIAVDPERIRAVIDARANRRSAL
jgi:hypothetical protein